MMDALILLGFAALGFFFGYLKGKGKLAKFLGLDDDHE